MYTVQMEVLWVIYSQALTKSLLNISDRGLESSGALNQHSSLCWCSVQLGGAMEKVGRAESAVCRHRKLQG